MKQFSAERIQQMLAEARAKAGVLLPAVIEPPIIEVKAEELVYDDAPTHKIPGVARDDIIYNALQQEFIDRGSKGEDVVLIGAAGTGKTTCQRGLSKKLIAEKKIANLSSGTKWLKQGVPGVAVVSFTNKAVNNIRHAVDDKIKQHCLTLHKLLEFAPIFYEIMDETTGQMRKTMRFEPTRTKYNPLPSGLKLIIFEESSMISVELYEMLMDACPHKPQVIFLGDIQQLPPVFGSAILGFKMLELPVIELTEVHRQAMNSPILSLAWKILAGDAKVFDSRSTTVTMEHPILKKEVQRKIIPALETLSYENEDGKVFFQPWQKALSADNGLLTLTKQFNAWADNGYYNPDDDIILCPFNVSFGTIEINKGIAQHLGRKRGAVVYEVIAGFNKHYLAVGDRVLYEKEDAFITDIAYNGEYIAKSPQVASKFLDRWGHLRTEDMDADAMEEQKKTNEDSSEFSLESIDKFLAAAASENEDRVTAASHCITIKIGATGEEVLLEAAGEVNLLLGGYCITVHKSQGSEWNKVFLALHQSHATMIQRELLYTAATRAKRHLHIICEPHTFERGVVSQKIRGNTLAEKAVYFQGKMEEREKLQLEKLRTGESDPIKLAFALVPQWDAQMRDATNHWWSVAQKRWPHELGNVAAPSMNWKIKGSAAGLANYVSKEIFLSPVYLHLDPNDMIADTVPHEVAHIVAWIAYKERGHGFGWQQVMKHFKIDPKTSHYHQLGKLPAALQRIMADSLQQAVANQDEEE
jgi:hypothetical protein